MFRRKKYMSIDFSEGYPVGKNIYYECSECNEVIPSTPIDSLSCKCGNVSIDVDAGRISINDDNQVKIFSR